MITTYTKSNVSLKRSTNKKYQSPITIACISTINFLNNETIQYLTFVGKNETITKNSTINRSF